jgi:hypothetical protein
MKLRNQLPIKNKTMRGLAAIGSMPVRLKYKLMKRYYFENSVLCGNCNGTGLQGYMDYCRLCNGTGITPYPIYLRERKGELISMSIEYKKCFNELKQL